MRIPVKDRLYASTSNEERMNFAASILDKGADEAEKWFNSRVDDNDGQRGATIAVGTSLIAHYGNNLGDMEAVERVSRKLRELGTDTAQTLQAFAMISMFDPESAGAYAAAQAARRGKEITKEEYDKAVELARDISKDHKEQSTADALVEATQRRLAGMRRELDALEADNKKTKFELAEAIKELEDLRVQLGKKQTFTGDPKTQRELYLKLKGQEKDILAKIQAKFGSAAMKMVTGEDGAMMRSVSQPAIDPLVLDFATLRLLDAFENQVEPEAYIRELDAKLNGGVAPGQALFTPEKLNDIMLAATERARQFGKPQSDESRTRAALRSRYYNLANDHHLNRIRQDAWETKAYPNIYIRQLAIRAWMDNASEEVQFLAYLRRARLSEDEMLEQFAKKFGEKDRVEVRKLLVEANKLHNRTNDDLTRRREEIRNNRKLSDAELESLKERSRVVARNKAAKTQGALKFYATLTRTDKRIVVEALVGLRRANLLTAPTTHLRNIVGNLVFGGADEASRNLAAGVDMALSRKTGRRTVQPTKPGQWYRAFRNLWETDETLQKAGKESSIVTAKNILFYGDSIENLTKLNLTESFVQGRFNNKATKIFDGYVNGVFRALAAEDALFKIYAFRRALEEQGASLNPSDPMSLVKNPTQVMILEAQMAADFATFQNSNKLSNAITSLKRLSWWPAMSDKAWGAEATINTIVPFERTPTNIILRMLDYTPLGLVRATGQAIKWRNPDDGTMKTVRNTYQEALEKDLMDMGNFALLPPVEQAKIIDDGLKDIFNTRMQREFSKTVGRAGLGTATVTLGYVLTMAGYLTGFLYPDDDDKKETSEFFAREWEGIENGSLLIPGWGRFRITDDPYGKALTLGATIYEQQAIKSNFIAGTSDAIRSAIAEQPLMNGVGNFIDAVPATLGGKGKTGAYLGSMAGSLVPTSGLLNRIGEVTDAKARTRSGYKEGEPSRFKDNAAALQYNMRGFRNSFLKGLPIAREYADESTFQNPDLRPKTALGRSKYLIDIFQTQPPIPYEVGMYKGGKPSADLKPPTLKNIGSASNASQSLEMYDRARREGKIPKKALDNKIKEKYRRARSDKSWDTYEMFFEAEGIPYKKLSDKAKAYYRKKNNR